MRLNFVVALIDSRRTKRVENPFSICQTDGVVRYIYICSFSVALSNWGEFFIIFQKMR